MCVRERVFACVFVLYHLWTWCPRWPEDSLDPKLQTVVKSTVDAGMELLSSARLAWVFNY